MGRSRSIGIWSIVAGIVLNNLSYLVDLMKDHSGVIMLGLMSAGGIVVGIGLVLYGMFVLLRASPERG